MTQFWKPTNDYSKSELALFAQRPMQTDIESSHFVNVYPLNSTKAGNGPIEFLIQGSGEDYIDMDNTLLCLRVRVKKSDNTQLADGLNVAPVNNWMHSLFSDITCHMNETLIEGGNHMYAYKAYLTNLLLYGEAMKKYQLQTSGFVKDDAGSMSEATNKGFITRKAFTKESRLHDLIGPLHLDICQQGKLILNQVDIKIKLTRSKPEFNIISLDTVVGAATTNAIDCMVEIEEAYLKVRRVQVAPDIIRQNEEGLQLQNAVYPIQRTEMVTYTIAQGSMSHVKENLFHGQLPKMIILGMVNNDDFNGKKDTNPFTFRHKKLTHLGLYRDGLPTPQVPFTPDFDNHLYAEEYMNLIDALGMSSSDGDIGLTKNDFGNGYTLFAFNLAPDKVVAGHAQPVKDGNLRVDMKFSTALGKAINVIAMAIFDDEIEITRLRKVAINYQT